MRKAFLFFVLFFAFCNGCGGSRSAEQQALDAQDPPEELSAAEVAIERMKAAWEGLEYVPHSVVFTGPEDSELFERLEYAMSLLHEKHPEAYRLVNLYVAEVVFDGRIDSDIRTGFIPRTGVFTAGYFIIYSDWHYLVSVLAHEAYHGKLYWEVPWQERDISVFSGPEAERKCNAFQAEVLEVIGGSMRMVEALRAADGKHADFNNDGVINGDDKDAQWY